MAYAQPYVEEEQEKKDEDESPIVAPASATEGGLEGPSDNTLQQQSTGPSGTFTNLQQFIDSNQEQAGVLAGKVAGEITKQTGEAEGAYKTAQEQFGEAVKGGTLNYDQDLLNRVVADPTGTEGDPEMMAALRKQRSGQYGGPADLYGTEYYDPLQKELGDIRTLEEQAKSTGGRQEILRSIAEPGSQTQGGTQFDQLLLQNSFPAWEQITDAAAGINPVLSQEDAYMKALGELVKTGQATSAATGTQAQQALTQAQGGIQSTVEQRVADRIQQATTTQQAVKNALENAVMPAPEQLAQMGITQAQFQDVLNKQAQARTYGGGVNVANYLTQQNPASVYTPNTVASREEAAKYEALSRLGELPGGYLSTESIVAAKPMMSYDVSGATQALQQQIDTGLARQSQAQYQQQAMDASRKAGQPSAGQSMLSGASSGASIGAAVCNGIGAIVGGVIGAIVGLFGCFTAGTPILMANGTTKNVEELELGDIVSLGGIVTGVGKVLNPDIWWYRGAFVSGSHVVFHDGKWATVESLEGIDDVKKVVLEGGTHAIVYPIVCEKHLLVTGDFISADFALIDEPFEMTETQRLEYLNGWDDRNEQLQKMQDDVRGEITVLVAAKESYESEAVHA